MKGGEEHWDHALFAFFDWAIAQQQLQRRLNGGIGAGLSPISLAHISPNARLSAHETAALHKQVHMLCAALRAASFASNPTPDHGMNIEAASGKVLSLQLVEDLVNVRFKAAVQTHWDDEDVDDGNRWCGEDEIHHWLNHGLELPTITELERQVDLQEEQLSRAAAQVQL